MADKEKKEKKEVKLTPNEIQNLISIVGSHPTPQGITSQEGQLKAALIQKLQGMKEDKPVEKNN